MVSIIEVKTKKQLRCFVDHPNQLYRDVEQFVPATYGDDLEDWDRSKNPAFAYCDARCWLAYRDGEVVGLVGESGSGKTVTAMTLSGLIERKKVTLSGEVRFDGRDILRLPRAELRAIQGRELGVVFQEPMTAMDPLMRIGPQVEEALAVHTQLTKEQRRARALEALRDVDLPAPEEIYRKYPHECSGGQLQRVMIAAAIVTDPHLLLLDEPTTALDVTVQAQILALLRRLNRERGISMLLISHNLQVVRRICSRVAVMQRGHIVEEGAPEQLFTAPQHPYTAELINAIPRRVRRG